MPHDDCSENTSEVPAHHRPGRVSSYLRSAAHHLAGGGKTLHFGGSPSRALAEAREKQLALMAALPSFDGNIGEHVATGGEHVVHLSPDGQRVLKFTLPGEFGFCVDEVLLLDSRTFTNKVKLTHRRALPSEYLWRWLVLRKVFGLLTEVEGMIKRTDGTPALVISQPFIGEEMPNWEEVEAQLTGQGFARVDNALLAMPEMYDVIWYRKRDGVIISDAYPRNFRMDSTGAIIPVDLLVNIVPPGSSKILPLATEPFQLPIS